ncbi:MAG: substrate-binding domain-containing protein [Chloroflexota bacterium]|nr:substrate-binding domain-containing protein [Chloroflexota bacterium]
MRKRWYYLITTLTVLSLLVGCSTPTPSPTSPPPTSPPPTSPPPTSPPPPEPTNTPQQTEPQALILATTTSTENSGLLGFILPDFEEEYGVTVDVIAVGTGQALKLGEDGNADVLMVHARALEDAFMEAGHGVRREDVMYNDFVIVGPADDPAGLRGMNDAAGAFQKLAEAQAIFVSRGDESGTHTKEKGIWEAAGVEPAGDWYISAGQGMGAVLTMADEQQAYTLSDRATYLARTLEGIELEILVEGDPVLFNPYGVIAVNPDKGAHIKNDLANTFIDWLISVPTQEKIGQFGVAEFGSPLFTPDSDPWREANPAGSETASDIPEDAALKITGKVTTEVGWLEEDVRAMEAIDVQSTNKDGEISTYTGVLITKLLEMAGPQEDATALVFVADDGYTAEVALADVQACQDCIVSFRNKGGFSMVLPGFPGNVQVKGVIEIQVK